jgi:hypothetical protein
MPAKKYDYLTINMKNNYIISDFSASPRKISWDIMINIMPVDDQETELNMGSSTSCKNENLYMLVHCGIENVENGKMVRKREKFIRFHTT